MDCLVDYDPSIRENIIDFLQDMEDDSITCHIHEFFFDHDLLRRSPSSYVPGYRIIIYNPSFRGGPEKFKIFMSHIDEFEKKLKSWGYQYHRFEDISSYGRHPLERVQFHIKATFSEIRPNYEYIKYYFKKNFKWFNAISNVDSNCLIITPKYENGIKKDEMNHIISNAFKNLEVKFEIRSRFSGFDIIFDLK